MIIERGQRQSQDQPRVSSINYYAPPPLPLQQVESFDVDRPASSIYSQDNRQANRCFRRGHGDDKHGKDVADQSGRRQKRANPTSAMLTAFSISSMPIRMATALLFARAP